MIRKRTILAPVLAALLMIVWFSAGAPVAETRLTFLHINDVYVMSPKRGLGGLAELQTLLARERRKAKHVLTTFGGDLLSPSLLSSLTKGAHMIEMLNALDVDLAVLGNHEFDHGAEILAKRIAESRFSWLASNVRGADGKVVGGGIEVWTRKMGGVTVGAFGLLTPATKDLAAVPDSVTFQPIVAAAKQAVAELRRRGAEVIVALTHQSLEDDRRLAGAVAGIHLILGGHEHVPMTLYEGRTLILKAGSNARYLGVVELAVERRGKESRTRLRVVPSWRLVAVRGVEPDSRVAALIAQFRQKHDAKLNVPVGITETTLDSTIGVVRQREAAIGNLIADAMRARLGADVALINGGGIRGDRIYAAGTRLSRRDIHAELPFGNVVVLLEVRGAKLRAALEHGLGAIGRRGGRFLQVAGLTIAYDPSAPAGRRLAAVKVGGRDLDENEVYKVATVDYLARGGDGFAMLKGAKRLVAANQGPLLATVVSEHIAARGRVAPKVGGRITARR